MHNFVFFPKCTRLSLQDVKKGLHQPKRDFVVDNFTVLRQLFVKYNMFALSDKFHLLTPAKPNLPTDKSSEKANKKTWRDNAFSLYGNRPYVNAHWENLKEKNGGRKLKCPICGVRDTSEMDHYVPRDVDMFPEYSCHLNNLIPLCHECNNAKSNKFLKGGDRIFFNAYYDSLKGICPIECKIDISPIDGNPCIVVLFNPRIDVTSRPGNIIKSTFDEFEFLLPLLQEKASDYLRCEIKKLLKLSKIGRKEVMKSYKSSTVDECIDFVQLEVYNAIGLSAKMSHWVASLPDIPRSTS